MWFIVAGNALGNVVRSCGVSDHGCIADVEELGVESTA